MTLKVLYISTFVLLALLHVVGRTHILKLIVGISLVKGIKRVDLGIRPVTHAQTVHADCVFPQFF